MTGTAAARAAATTRTRSGRSRWGRIAWIAAASMAFAVVPTVSLVTERAGAADCTISATLVNSCRPWLGAWANTYPQVAGGFTSQISYHEQRIGRKVDVVHQYHLVGQNTLSSEEIAYARRTGTILYVNWKPVYRFIDGAGGNATANASIDTMAKSIKSVGTAKVLLTVFHEPENDASSLPNCPSGTAMGNAGGPSEYRALWQNVRNRFDALGVTNVVWVMNYMGYRRWDCTVRDFWPGNSLVDWVTFDLYPTGTATFDSVVVRFYNVLTNYSDATHDFVSKPWGMAEFGVRASTQAHAYAFYDAMRSAVVTNRLPRMKLYMPFDTKSAYDNRLLYTAGSAIDWNEQNRYNLFANDPTMVGAWTQPTA